MNEINMFVESHKKRFLDELFELIRIPSVSSLPEHKPDMYRAAEKWKEILLAAGVDRAEVLETDGNPVTYGEKIIDSKAPTVLVYGHMDVMPVDPLDRWVTDPFEPVVRDGRIWARGADDDKGQAFMHAKAFEYLVQSGRLACNVKFLIEGEEEVGSPSLPEFCRRHREMLQADVILVSDTSMIARDVPSITTGLRGLAYWQVEVTGPATDLHSGLFGGAVANPVNVLSKMIARTVDDGGHILIPGFYDDVAEVSEEERALMAKAPFSLQKYKESVGVKEVFGEKGYTTGERTGIRPTFDVCGFWGGYTGEGAKTVLPSRAYAKISCRLVPNQDHRKIAGLFAEYFASIAPESVTVKVDYLHGGPSYVCPIDLPAYGAAAKALRDVYGMDPVPVRSGGSIPIIATFEEVLGIKSVLMGFGLGSDAIHSPNENFPLEQFYNGIRTLPLFYRYFAEVTG
ncbi:MAG: dipeptidase [Proteiniphilum sp.]|jgi:acetylornithine deacetylase/succinyl-diaminopimelate desuccinylase-like protein|nr:dipeptidase [Proteiniphilum sp.]